MIKSLPRDRDFRRWYAVQISTYQVRIDEGVNVTKVPQDTNSVQDNGQHVLVLYVEEFYVVKSKTGVQ